MTSQVSIIGSGNWGSTVAMIIGENVHGSTRFKTTIKVWVYDEIIDGEKLSQIINTRHENPKYLPGVKLPPNVVAFPDLESACKDSTHFVFVLPHQFIQSTCNSIKGFVKPGSYGISLIKGFIDDPNELKLASKVISDTLGIHMSVLSGANIATEIANKKFSTTSIGCEDPKVAEDWKALFSTLYFKVELVGCVGPVEISGALKNVVALSVGFAEALGYGNNAKASIIRIGLKEIIKFVRLFYPDIELNTFLESFCLDDVITTCYGGRNLRAAEVFIRNKKEIADIERELLNGQKLQGPQTAVTVYNILTNMNLKDQFPLFCFVHDVMAYKIPAENLVSALLAS